jgi:hypothetical protein
MLIQSITSSPRSRLHKHRERPQHYFLTWITSPYVVFYNGSETILRDESTSSYERLAMVLRLILFINILILGLPSEATMKAEAPGAGMQEHGHRDA